MRNYQPSMSAVLVVTGLALGLAPASAQPRQPSTAATAPPPATATFDANEPFRPPAVPLVAHDPYLSVWSFGNRLTDDWPRHWTGAINALCGFAWIDGRPYRWCGPEPRDVPAADQRRLTVTPTRTIYELRAGGVDLTVTFCSPLLPHDLDLVSRPITYVTITARTSDDATHTVRVYLDCSAEWCVNTPDQQVHWSRGHLSVGDQSLDVLSFWSVDQAVLARAGDNVRIDWGTFHLAVPTIYHTTDVIAPDRIARATFAKDGTLPNSDDFRQPRAVNDEWPVLATMVDYGTVGRDEQTATWFIGYDDRYSLEYFNRRVRPYWRRAGAEYVDILTAAVRDCAEVQNRCRAFDDELLADLRRAGGEPYARLATLAYRQTMAAHKLVADFDGTPLMFPKENFSNGCIGTVDVIFPSAPYFLLLNPRLLEAQLQPVLDYARPPRWRFPFAPHDLGTYPLANGQVYGGGERGEQDQMPVEETANMLVLLGALAEIEGNADFADHWWPVVTRWAEYLREKGLDPENQLCTDDFAGHLAHNANLSIKAIIGLGAYARLCERTHRTTQAETYRATAKRFVTEWQRLADDGDHYRLAFDRPGTWSLKYNLFWDRLLPERLFPPDVARREVAYYLTKLNRFGVPLDGRETYAKLDFSAWSACLADQREDLEALLTPLYDFAQQTPDRMPLTDWYQTTTGKCVGFRARSVVGGLYAPLLLDQAIWRKWADRR